MSRSGRQDIRTKHPPECWDILIIRLFMSCYGYEVVRRMGFILTEIAGFINEATQDFLCACENSEVGMIISKSISR